MYRWLLVQAWVTVILFNAVVDHANHDNSNGWMGNCTGFPKVVLGLWYTNLDDLLGYEVKENGYIYLNPDRPKKLIEPDQLICTDEQLVVFSQITHPNKSWVCMVWKRNMGLGGIEVTSLDMEGTGACPDALSSPGYQHRITHYLLSRKRHEPNTRYVACTRPTEWIDFSLPWTSFNSLKVKECARYCTVYGHASFIFRINFCECRPVSLATLYQKTIYKSDVIVSDDHCSCLSSGWCKIDPFAAMYEIERVVPPNGNDLGCFRIYQEHKRTILMSPYMNTLSCQKFCSMRGRLIALVSGQNCTCRNDYGRLGRVDDIFCSKPYNDCQNSTCDKFATVHGVGKLNDVYRCKEIPNNFLGIWFVDGLPLKLEFYPRMYIASAIGSKGYKVWQHSQNAQTAEKKAQMQIEDDSLDQNVRKKRSFMSPAFDNAPYKLPVLHSKLDMQLFNKRTESIIQALLDRNNRLKQRDEISPKNPLENLRNSYAVLQDSSYFSELGNNGRELNLPVDNTLQTNYFEQNKLSEILRDYSNFNSRKVGMEHKYTDYNLDNKLSKLINPQRLNTYKFRKWSTGFPFYQPNSFHSYSDKSESKPNSSSSTGEQLAPPVAGFPVRDTVPSEPLDVDARKKLYSDDGIISEEPWIGNSDDPFWNKGVQIKARDITCINSRLVKIRSVISCDNNMVWRQCLTLHLSTDSSTIEAHVSNFLGDWPIGFVCSDKSTYHGPERSKVYYEISLSSVPFYESPVLVERRTPNQVEELPDFTLREMNVEYIGCRLIDELSWHGTQHGMYAWDVTWRACSFFCAVRLYDAFTLNSGRFCDCLFLSQASLSDIGWLNISRSECSRVICEERAPCSLQSSRKDGQLRVAVFKMHQYLSSACFLSSQEAPLREVIKVGADSATCASKCRAIGRPYSVYSGKSIKSGCSCAWRLDFIGQRVSPHYCLLDCRTCSDTSKLIFHQVIAVGVRERFSGGGDGGNDTEQTDAPEACTVVE